MILSRITIFPIKSLDGVDLTEVRLTAGGMLENDRAYAILDEKGAYVNGKRNDRVHRLRCAFSTDLQEVTLREEHSGAGVTFALGEEPIHAWLSSFFGFSVRLHHEPVSGYPDDREAFGPTVVAEASLVEVASWYPRLALESVRRRFRTNLEIDPAEVPFCEDRLYGAPGEQRPLRIGEARFLGHNPCQRCVVPTRDPAGAGAVPGFQKHFMKRREETLPAWADRRRFNHFYRFAVNTSTPPGQGGKTLRRGDRIEADPDPTASVSD